jgi:hypothetical protein
MKPLQLLHIVIQTPKGDISREQIKHLIYGMSIYRAVFLLELAQYDTPVRTNEMTLASQKCCDHRYLKGWKGHERYITMVKHEQFTNPHSYCTYVLTGKGREEAREIEANLQQMIDNVSNQNRKIA